MDKIDNIYIYVWEEFNTVYVGRTKNPKSRHYAHKHRETESTYKFSSEHHVEHPPMIILETDLTVGDGAEREKYWIEYYKESTPYNVLNKSRGGQLGKLPVYTEEERKKHKKHNEKQYEITHKDELRKKRQEYYKNHREKILARNKEYKKEHHDEIRKKYWEKTEEKRILRNTFNAMIKKEKEEKKLKREEDRKYREEHKFEIEAIKKERKKINNKKYRENNKDHIREYHKQYYEKKKQLKNVNNLFSGINDL